MDQNPLISYVVTAYNIEEYIAEAIQCAFAQTYSPLEIVLSDDCSTDRTFEIMQQMASEYKGPHKIVLNRNTENLGITRHMNKAYIDIANGQIIVAAHGDDISDAKRTELSWLFLRDNLEITAVSFSLDAFDDKGNFLPGHSSSVDCLQLYDFKKGGNIPAPSRAFYKRVMLVFGPLNEDCPTEDECISFRALLLGKNAFLPDHIVKYRKHEKSSSNPEFFDRFPLEKILKQQDDDMKKAVQLGLIDDNDRQRKYAELEKNMHLRKVYREYFSKRTISSWVKLVMYKNITTRRRFHYIKEHFEFLMGNHE